jgi:hypothetical protein
MGIGLSSGRGCSGNLLPTKFAMGYSSLATLLPSFETHQLPRINMLCAGPTVSVGLKSSIIRCAPVLAS